MTDGLRFRSVRHGDEEVLAALEARVEPTPWTVGDFADVLRNGWFCDVLELDDGSIGAWAVVMPVLDEAELLTIGVRPDLQGRGLGRAMLDRMTDAMRTRKCTRCHLEVRESNERAIRLYETSGFVRVGLRKNYYRTAEGREHAVLMTLDSEVRHAERRRQPDVGRPRDRSAVDSARDRRRDACRNRASR